MEFPNPFLNRRVLVTGHTGFKGAWLCQALLMAGAKVTGYALKPPTDPNLYKMLNLKDKMISIEGDIRNLDGLLRVFETQRPEFVFHLAAQPIVRESYRNPVYTYETNVMGTVNVLECVRRTPSVRSVVNVTTDKVYKNKEWVWGYRENEELNGFDPYSNSKSCSELVTDSYVNSFFGNRELAVSTARAGNVIGGGDFAADRIIPDCIRAALKGEDIIIRNPGSIRPFQHVLEPVMAYLMIGAGQYEDRSYAGCYNVGPDEKDCVTTGDLAALFCEKWKSSMGGDISWRIQPDGGPHEANYLKLDCSKLKNTFGWRPKWDIGQALEKTVGWTAAYSRNEDMEECVRSQIAEYMCNMG